MVQKVGPYAPCPCGSGLKFSKCCAMRGERAIKPTDFSQLYKNPRFGHIINPTKHFKRYRFIPISSIKDENNRCRWVGNRSYLRPSTETFHEFLIHLLKWTLGKNWHEQQLSLPFEERHQIFKWFRAATEFSKLLMENPEFRDGEHYGAAPTGDVEALNSLAYDVFLLLHLGPMPKELLDRLRNKQQFQGVRYEIIVAAILLRAGCVPIFNAEKSKKHCDISAVDVATGDSIAIEAKSRHRPGTLGFQGDQNTLTAMRGDIASLINQALEQNPGDRPFLIFIDLNSPHMPESPIQERPWFNDMWRLMQSLGDSTAEKPDDFNALILTNFSYHWQGAEKATGGDYLFIHSKFPRHSLPSDITARIVDSINTHGAIPKEV